LKQLLLLLRIDSRPRIMMIADLKKFKYCIAGKFDGDKVWRIHSF